MAFAPDLLACFTATVLLVFVCVSTPTWDKISLLDVIQTDGTRFQFGVFGFTGSKVAIGYDFGGVEDVNVQIVADITKAFVLHPLAAGLSGIAFLLGFCGLSNGRGGVVISMLSSLLASIAALAAFAVDIAFFTFARTALRNAGVQAEYGIGIWLTLSASIVLVLGFISAVVELCTYQRRHKENEA